MKHDSKSREASLSLSGLEIARNIREGRYTSRSVVEAHIGQIQRVNPRLNAIVAERFELALAEADKADEMVRAGDDLPVFHGVPCTVKECFALEGMPNSAGLVSRAHIRAKEDATAVCRIRKAGAIPMGVTNTSELCLWMETKNQLYGLTRNPYDASRIVGGSSGGEGAIIGAGGSPFGVGSDIGGSIRMPAFFNGVFGHKPTGGLVPGTGQYPLAEGRALRYLTTGPLTRRAEDLYPLLKLMAGPDGLDTGALEMPIGEPKEVSMEGLRVVMVEGNGIRRVSKELLRDQHKVAKVLESLGANVVYTEIRGLKKSLDIWSNLMTAASDTAFRDILADGTNLNLSKEMLKWVRRKSPHTLPAILLARVETIPIFAPQDPSLALAAARKLRTEIEDMIGPRGVMLYPSYTRAAPRHKMPIATPFDWVYTAIFNTLELPATQIPTGLSKEGLPLGVQVVGTRGSDHVTIAVAETMEKEIGGWIPPWLA